METLKAITRLKKADKGIITKAGYIHTNYKKPLERIRIVDEKIYYFTWDAKGRNYTDYGHNIKVLLHVLGYKYSLYNDAPKGGKNGNYIKVSKKAIETLIKLSKYGNL